jgi:flagellar hook-associated protein 1 FlgK
MSLDRVIGSSLTGLSAAQTGLATVAANIAGAKAPGYARQEAVQETLVAGGDIVGVRATVRRVADAALEAAAAVAGGDAGRTAATSGYLDRLQSLLGAPGSEGGLTSRIDAVAASAVTLASGSDPVATRADFVAKTDSAFSAIASLATDMDAIAQDVAGDIDASVARANELLERIGRLNDQFTGSRAAGVADQRASAVAELGGLIAIRTRLQPDGRLMVDAASGATLVDARVRTLAADPTGPLRVSGADGSVETALSSPGGRLGGLVDLRDRTLPAAADKLVALSDGLASALNAVHNEHASLPAPARLEGRDTGLIASDRLRMTGSATFAVTDANGKLVASTTIDAGANPAATVANLVSAINSGLAGTATASFSAGRLTITATDPRNGIAIAADAANPATRAGTGLSAFFGLNDLVRGAGAPPSGLAAADAHGLAAGGTARFAIRDAAGRITATDTLFVSGTATIADLISQANTSELASKGSFALDANGRLQFTPAAGQAGATLVSLVDSTTRGDTGRSLSSILGVTTLDGAAARTTGAVRADIATNPDRLAVARLDTTAAVGGIALAVGDERGTGALADALSGPAGAALERAATSFVSSTSTAAARATDEKAAADARLAEAERRRDAVSGVNVDAELARMIQLQNSYAASARVLSAARDLYDTLLGMMR